MIFCYILWVFFNKYPTITGVFLSEKDKSKMDKKKLVRLIYIAVNFFEFVQPNVNSGEGFIFIFEKPVIKTKNI